MRENGNEANPVRQLISTIFMSPAAVPPFMEYFITLVEFFLFTVFVSSNSGIDSLIFGSVIQRNIIIFLVGLLLLRSLTKVTIIKSIYPMVLMWNIQCDFGVFAVIVYALLLMHILIDIISKIEFSFETKNMHSSTHPWFIALHYLIMVSITVLRYINLPKAFIFPLCEILAFALLIIVQFRAIMKYEQFKNLHLRFYFLSFFYAMAECYEIFVSKEPLWKNLFAILASQLIYEFIQWKTTSEFSVEEYISKKMEIEAGYYIFSFLYTKKPINKSIIKALKTLANEDTNCLIEEKTFKESMMNTKRGMREQFLSISSSDTREVSSRLLVILKENSSVYAQIFLAELALHEMEQHVKCRHILSFLQRRNSCMNVLSKILINKIEKKLFTRMHIEHDKCSTPNFFEFIENDKFRNLLLKSSLNFIDLWEYTKVKEGIYKRINELAEKVINSMEKIRQSYEQLKVKCIRINLLYGNYLFCVERNNELANQIMENLYFYQEKEQNIECDSKVYIKIAINPKEPLKIAAVGCNVNKHLGYERRLLPGINVSEMLPDFYKEIHDNRVIGVLENQTSRLFLFTRSTIVKHAKGKYVTALLCVRLTYDHQGSLFMEGFVRVNSDEKHNWHNYLFVKHATKEIIECSALVNDKISQGKGRKFNADEYFDNCDREFYKNIQKYTSDINKYFYEPIVSFDTGDDHVTMFVELDPYAESIEHRVDNEKEGGKRKILIPEMIVYPKYKVFNNIKHFLRKKVSTRESLESIRMKLIIFVLVIGLMVMGVYVLQGAQMQSLNKEYENKVETMVITDNILRHYMSLGKIGIDLSYLVVNQMYGYEFPGFNISLKENIMTVQQTNQYFKKYSISEWQYESMSSIQEYRTCYEFISEILGAASFIDQVSKDKAIKENMIASFNELFTETFVWSYSEYTNRIQEQLALKTQNRDSYQIVIMVLLFLFCSVLYIVLIKLESYSRVSEHETLKFIGSITFQDQILSKTKEFIYLITEEKLENISNSKSITNAILNKNFGEGIKMSEISARESTGRDLMGNMSGRDTMRSAQNQLQKNLETQTQEFPIKLRSANKLFIILPLVLILGILGLQVFNYVLNVKMREINEAESSRNIVEWMNKPLFFTRLVNAFLTEDRGPSITDHDGTFYKAYKFFQNSYNSIASFDEINYAEFTEFEEKLRRIRFEYLCTYAKCPDLDKDYVNILYTTTMQKLAGYMLANQYFLSDPNHKMNIIMMSQQLFRQIMTDLIQTYIKNYQQYASNFKSNQILFITTIIGVVSIMMLALSLQIYFKVFKSLSKHFRICDIVKEKSYLINNEALISFEAEELQKQKIQQKKKQLVKKNAKDKENASELSENLSKILQEKSEKILSKSYGKSKLKNQEAERKLSIFKELQLNRKK